MGKYNTTHAQLYCARKGLHWHDGLMSAVMPKIKQAQLNQDQFDKCMEAHIDAVEFLFNAKNYTLTDRISLAVHFLFGGKLNAQDDE